MLVATCAKESPGAPTQPIWRPSDGAIAGGFAVTGTFTNAGVGERSRGVAELTSHAPRLKMLVWSMF